jgi:hypothetical protein
MTDRGYIKIYRSLFDNPVVCKDNDHLAVWLYLLCDATHKDYPVMFGGERITLKPGELTTGRNRIALKLNIHSSKVQRILKCFEIEQQIEQRTDRQCRLISIVNWEEYQNDEQRNGQRVNNEWTTSEQRVNTKQTHKHKNTETHKNIYSDLPVEIVESFEAFTDMRKKIKKPLTDKAIEMLLKKLNQLSGGDSKKSIQILDQSTMNSWASVYPLNEPKKKDNRRALQDLIESGAFDE